MKYLQKFSSVVLLVLICGCCRTKKSDSFKKNKYRNTQVTYYLHLRKGKPAGVLRIECQDCSFHFSMNGKGASVNVFNNSEDFFIFPKEQSFIHTTIKSNAKQKIRLLLIDPNGQIISNTLNPFEKGESSERKFNIGYHAKDKNTIVIITR